MAEYNIQSRSWRSRAEPEVEPRVKPPDGQGFRSILRIQYTAKLFASWGRPSPNPRHRNPLRWIHYISALQTDICCMLYEYCLIIRQNGLTRARRSRTLLQLQSRWLYGTIEEAGWTRELFVESSWLGDVKGLESLNPGCSGWWRHCRKC